ncbi:hypothetical protein HDE_00336 [Halotydeus destructor]|nr:hypothetical protein HDE_00336 [Halotydeus destructor]
MDADNKFKPALDGENRYPTHGLNCSEITVDGITMGHSDPVGNYDGLLGMIQRQEVDCALALTRLDCLGTSSLRVLAVAGSAEVRILSKKVTIGNQSLEHFEPLLDTMSLVDNWALVTLLASVVSVAMVITLAHNLAAVDKGIKAFQGRFVNTLWAAFELVVSQGKFNYVTAVQKLTWLTLTAGLFIIISGIFLNLVSTEQVAQREADQVDTFDDLFGNFKWLEPSILANYFTNGLRDLTRNGSRESELFQRIKSDDKNTYTLELNAQSGQEPTFLAAQKFLAEGGRYLLFEDILWKPDVLCNMLPKIFDSLHMSKDTILDGILVFVYNSNSDSRLIKYMSFRLSNKLEFGLHDQQVLQSTEILAQITGFWELGRKDATKCRFRGATSNTEADMLFKISHARSCLHFLGSVIVAAIASNILEILSGYISRVDDLDTEKQFKRIISEINHYPTHGLNCSEITIDGLTMGNSDRTGNYSGLLGMLQRQEVDYAPGLTRLDCLGGSSLRVMAVAGSAEVRIISKKMVPVNQSLEHFEPLIDTMFLFDNYSLFTLFVSVMAVAMVISIGDSKAPRKRFLESALKTLWASFELMVSQGKHRYVTAVQRLPWLHLTAGLFIIISGLFLNLLSTERVAQRELDQIDTFDDLFNKFNGQEPTIMANYFTNGLRHLTRPGTKENALFERIKSNENSTYKFDMKAGSTQELFHITAKKQLDEGRRYLLFEDMMLKPDVFCHILPTIFDKMHMSRDTILDGILAYLYNSNSDPMFVKYVSYRLTNKLEFGFFDREVLQSVETLAQITGYWELGKKGATRCRFRDATSKTVADIQFRLGYNGRMKSMTPETEYVAYENFLHGVSRYPTHGLNCSETIVDGFDMGNSDQAGNYSGLLGMIQRREVDYASTKSRLDCLGDKALRVLGISGSAEVRIISRKVVHVNKTIARFEPILDTLHLVDKWSFACLLASILAVALLISISARRTAVQNKVQANSLMAYYFRALWRSYELLVGQVKVSHVSVIPRFMWLSLTVGLFITVSGMFLNLLRTEQVAQREPDQIDTFGDLLHRFKWQKPTLMSNMFTNSLRHLTKNGSQEHELFEMIKSDETNTYTLETHKDSTQELSFFTFKTYLDEGRRYLLLENAYWFPNLFCHMVPNVFNTVHISKDTVLDGILVTLYNSNSDPRLAKFMSYRLTNKLEFGFEAMEMLQLVQDAAKLAGFWELGKKGATRCRFKDDQSPDIPDLQFKLSYASSVLYSVTSAAVAALVLINCELFVKSCVRSSRITSLTSIKAMKSKRYGSRTILPDLKQISVNIHVDDVDQNNPLAQEVNNG